MKAEKLRELNTDELRGKERELQEQLFRLRFQKSLGQLDNALKIRETRRDIARVKTVIKQLAKPAQG
jgi:large subunit ribosomal protein L29